MDELRIGHGWDVHRFTEERPLILCGVKIPHTQGLLGHSDADAPVHALIDALLGALALGDIGTFYPDTDPAYKGADSMQLLEKTLQMTPFPQWEIINIDLNIITQKPKMLPHIPAMKENLAKVLSLDLSRISIKAKTNEKLGYIGNGEALESSAVVLLRKKVC
ncbi:MAG: 2-C-methyl-D-erythritol 2,4-cyclodiphosphate synthase [Lentisphaeria bacterium]|nr:2-C-methyl-D-erythritol 2,4-cyclodiphosphate synthase [Lentisphaeria bacterium]